jgi:hypothetical protein
VNKILRRMKHAPLAILAIASASLAHPLLAAAVSSGYDAVTSATHPGNGIPSPPIISGIVGHPSIVQNSTLLYGGGLFTMTFVANDATASKFPGSLFIGTFDGSKCNTDGSNLPTGASLTTTTNSSTKVTGVIKWNVPKGFPATKIVPCAYNAFWVKNNGYATKYIEVSTQTPVKSVALSTLTYTKKTQILTIGGTVTPKPKTTVSGLPYIIMNSDTGETVATGLVNKQSISLKTKISSVPGSKLSVLVGEVLSTAKCLKIDGKCQSNVETISVTSPSTDSATMGITTSFQILAVDSLGKKLSFSLSTAPNGMTITSDGILAWTPSNDISPGREYSYTVVIDSGTFSISKTYSMGVCTQGEEWMYMGGGLPGHCM